MTIIYLINHSTSKLFNEVWIHGKRLLILKTWFTRITLQHWGLLLRRQVQFHTTILFIGCGYNFRGS
jgi:hypothetical protein